LAEAHGVFYPRNYLFLPPSPWRQHVFQSVPAETEFQVRDQVASIVPAKARILCDSPYLHAALIDKGIEVVPIWSPEVRFLFSLPPEETERRLRSLNIRSVVYNPISLNAGYLASASPFYASLPQRWRVQAQFPGGLEVLAQP
jgi:hypothetical protein